MRKSGRKNSSSRGSITSFMCIVIAAIIMFNCVLLDCARLLVLHETIERKIYFCAESITADYIEELQRGYGLYGIYGSDYEIHKNAAYNFLDFDSNLTSDIIDSLHYTKRNQLNFFEYDVSKLDVVHLGCITENAVLKDNICSLMKYKVPADLMSDLIDKVGIFEDATGLCLLEDLHSKLSNARNEAYVVLDSLEKAVFGTDYSTAGSVMEWKDFGAKSVNLQIEIITGVLPAVNTDVETKNSIKNQFENLKNTIQVYKNYISDALSYINEVSVLCDEIEDYKMALDEEFCNMDFSVDINLQYYKNTKNDLEATDNFLNRVSNMPARQKLQSNLTLLNDAETACNDSIAILVDNTFADINILSEKIKTIKKLNDISCEITLPDVNIQTVDENLSDYDISDKKKNSLANIFSFPTDIVIPVSTVSSLPSSETEKKYDADLSVIFDSFNFLNLSEPKSYSFDNVSDLGKVFTDKLNTATDNVYVNEYIMSFFFSGNEDVSDDRFFNAEIEYLIAGNTSQNANIENVYKQILSIRSTMNFIHILTDATKVNFANRIGEAVSATTMGVGAPLYSFIVMGMWATAEAAIDLADLKEGEAVPFYKMQGDWKLDIGLNNVGSAFLNELTDFQTESNVTSGESLMNMTYNDYLNVLLLSVPMDAKLTRICDLLELNLSKSVTEDFNISDVYTGISCDLKIMITPIVNFNELFNRIRGKKYELRFIGSSIY